MDLGSLATHSESPIGFKEQMEERLGNCPLLLPLSLWLTLGLLQPPAAVTNVTTIPNTSPAPHNYLFGCVYCHHVPAAGGKTEAQGGWTALHHNPWWAAEGGLTPKWVDLCPYPPAGWRRLVLRLSIGQQTLTQSAAACCWPS